MKPYLHNRAAHVATAFVALLLLVPALGQALEERDGIGRRGLDRRRLCGGRDRRDRRRRRRRRSRLREQRAGQEEHRCRSDISVPLSYSCTVPVTGNLNS